MKLLLLATLPLALLSSTALAFDCGKASTPVEKIICADKALMKSDDRMVAAYNKLKGALDAGAKEALRISQLRWIKQREGCSYEGATDVPECVRDTTEKRLAVLTATPESGPGDGPDLEPWLVQKEGKKGSWDIDYNLVRIADPQSAGADLFNREVETQLLPALLEHSSLGTSTMKVEPDQMYAISVTLTPTYASKRLVSALAEGYEFAGGAHGNSWTRGINIDLHTARRLSFGDLFAREASGPIAQMCTTQLVTAKRTRLGDAAANLEDGADEIIITHVQDLERWSFKADRASITFDPYEIGSYAEGAYTCTLEMEKLRSLAIAGAPLPQ